MEIRGCPHCGAPAEVEEVREGQLTPTVRVRCIAHHTVVGPQDAVAPRLPWDVPGQRAVPSEERVPARAEAVIPRRRGAATEGALIPRDRTIRFDG